VESSIQLTDITTQTGISFIHRDGSCGDYNILETVTAGLALFDYDNDGDDDIYFVNGGTLKGTAYPSPPTNMLYRNDGNWKFTDVTAQSDAGDTSHGLAVAAADYDNDGDLDLYVSNYGPNVLYRNNGNGTFTDVTQQADVVGTNHVGAGVCFLDADGDGNLDLFVSDYVAFEYNAFPVKKLRGFPIYPGPKSHRPTTDRLYRNNGNGTFTDISRQAGFEEQAGYGMGTVCLDYDDDGDTDIVVANDEIGNFLFRNDSKGRFEEVGLISGLAYDVWGSEMGNMGVDCGDYDNDGRLDLYMTSYQDEYTALYRNLGDGMFEDVTLKTQAALGTLTHVTWGTCLVDFDNDGHRDIFVACGHLQDNVEKCEDAALYHVENILYRNITWTMMVTSTPLSSIHAVNRPSCETTPHHWVTGYRLSCAVRRRTAMEWEPASRSSPTTSFWSTKCTAAEAIRAITACACTLGWERAPRLIGSRSDGSVVGSMYFVASPWIGWSLWLRAASCNYERTSILTEVCCWTISL
jgi:hypothetical protein